MPLMKIKRKGRIGWRFGKNGKIYIGVGAKAKARLQERAVRASGWTENWNPSQPRDSQGRWSSGGGGGSVGASGSPASGFSPEQVADISLPPDDESYEYFYHSPRTSGELESIVETGVVPSSAGKTWLSKDEVRDRGAGFAIVRVPRGKAGEGVDFVETGLTYREWTVQDSIPPSDVVGSRKMVTDSTGFKIREDKLASAFLEGKVTPGELKDLPREYHHWKGITENWNPSQPRDDRGRWSSGGGSVSAAMSEVLGHSDGMEHSVLVDQTGEFLGTSVGDEESVNTFVTPRLKDSSEKLVGHHSHPFDTPPSLSDVLHLAENPGLAEIWAHSKEASYRVTAVASDRDQLYFATKDAYGDARIKLIDEMMDTDVKLPREEMYRRQAENALGMLAEKGLIEYERVPKSEMEGSVENAHRCDHVHNASPKRKKRSPNPLRSDPSRTATLRRRFQAEVDRRLNVLRRRIRALIVEEDAFGLADPSGMPKGLADNAYNPSQPRDSRGRWGSGGGGSGSAGETVGKYDGKTIYHFTASDESAEAIKQSGSVREASGLEGNAAYFTESPEGTGSRKGSQVAVPFTVQPGARVVDLSTASGEMSIDGWMKEHATQEEIDKGMVSSVMRRLGVDAIRLSRHSGKERWWLVANPGSLRVAGDAPTSNQFVVNQRWRFRTDQEKLLLWKAWLQEQLKDVFLGDETTTDDDWWTQYVLDGYRRGAERAFDDTRRPYARGYSSDESTADFYRGSKYEFLRSSFAQPASVAKTKLLASRVYTDLKGVTDAMGTTMARTLVDGFVFGKGPREIARDLERNLDGIGRNRARVIARSEIIRCHAEAQLDIFDRLGVEEVGVSVEWLTAEDDRVCPLCSALNGVVLKVEEARGLLPRHPQCRCCWTPSGVGESTKGQKRTKSQIEKALDSSVAAEISVRSGRTLEEQRERTTWIGADALIGKKRPKSIL